MSYEKIFIYSSKGYKKEKAICLMLNVALVFIPHRCNHKSLQTVIQETKLSFTAYIIVTISFSHINYNSKFHQQVYSQNKLVRQL